MTELSNQRTNLLSTQHRLDLDQLFKTKMKLIDDSALVNGLSSGSSSNGTLNTSLSSASSNSILQANLGDLSYGGGGGGDASDEAAFEAPSSVKQVFNRSLNEIIMRRD